jgi:hypothetical protein
LEVLPQLLAYRQVANFPSEFKNLHPAVVKGPTTMSQKPPIHVIRMGLIKASIWQNQTKVGLRHNVTVVRLFRNGDVWQESTRFGRDDLLLLAKILERAHDWIFFHTTEDQG